MKTFEINNVEYTVSRISAIACAAGDTERQEALLVTSTLESGEKSEYVVFGFEMPNDTADFRAMCEEPSAWDSDPETLDSVSELNDMRCHMIDCGGDMEWCCPFRAGRVVFTICEGRVGSLQIDGKTVPANDENIREAARIANPEYSNYEGWSDTHILLESECEELGCRSCPWFWSCDAMDA